ncbi:uncharacterized protein LOC106638566 [Copidosoma floridanum]|uniref:uncharacterized protein LOC106638566 n=1 Tax=Copidosoma floridanum TaxID=29053 RepID=UPI000C6F5E58|nr:uncharacterized protein LOC106638566 [Copidosoma floridanum]
MQKDEHLKLAIKKKKKKKKKNRGLIKETNKILRILVFKTVIGFVIYCICAGLQLHNGAMTLQVMNQFLILIVNYLRLFLFAESAENLESTSTNVQMAVYSTKWYHESPKITTNSKVFIMQRCQKIPRIYVNGFMSALNRNYLGKMIYVTFSYFMTVRQIVKVKVDHFSQKDIQNI